MVNDRCPKCGVVLSVEREVFGEEHDSSKCVPRPDWKSFWEHADKETLSLIEEENLMKEGYEAMAEENGEFAKKAEWCPQHDYPLPCAKCGLGDYEAGKQAGIKEVMDYTAPIMSEISRIIADIRGDWTDPRQACRDAHRLITKWEAKLKECKVERGEASL